MAAEESRLNAAHERNSDRIVGRGDGKSPRSPAQTLIDDGIEALASVFIDPLENQSVILQKLKTVREARAITRKRMEEAFSAASGRMAEARKPEYAAIVAKMQAAIKSLLKVMQEETAFRRQAELDDVSLNMAMRTMRLDPWPLECWLKAASEYYGL